MMANTTATPKEQWTADNTASDATDMVASTPVIIPVYFINHSF